jgi:hypothetical protein
MRSALARGAITALYWLFRPPVPQATHGTIEEAMQWARETAIAEGLGDPGDVQDWLQSYDRRAGGHPGLGSASDGVPRAPSWLPALRGGVGARAGPSPIHAGLSA